MTAFIHATFPLPRDLVMSQPGKSHLTPHQIAIKVLLRDNKILIHNGYEFINGNGQQTVIIYPGYW